MQYYSSLYSPTHLLGCSETQPTEVNQNCQTTRTRLNNTNTYRYLERELYYCWIQGRLSSIWQVLNIHSSSCLPSIPLWLNTCTFSFIIKQGTMQACLISRSRSLLMRRLKKKNFIIWRNMLVEWLWTPKKNFEILYIKDTNTN